MREEIKSEENKRVCIGCKKELLDEKFPFCLRCRLSGRDKAGHVGELLVGLAVVAGGVKALSDNNNGTKA